MKIENDHITPAAWKNQSDLELVARLKTGDQRVFEEIYNRYKGPLYIYATKKLNDTDDVLDILQEIFSRLWEKKETLDIQDLSAYLYQAVRYKIIDRFSKMKSAQGYLESLKSFAETHSGTTDYLARERMFRSLIEKEISCLPPRMREVFELSRKEGLSHKEIGRQLNLTEQSVRSHVKNALKVLRHKMGYFLWLTCFFFR